MPGRGKTRWVVSTTIWKSPQYITMWERQTWNNVLRTMDQHERLTPSCWVPCLIGHKKYLLVWLHLSQYRVKFKNSDPYLSTDFQLQHKQRKGGVE